MIALKSDVLRPLDDVLQDTGFWTEFEARLAAEVVPLFYEVFVAGAIAGVQVAKTSREKQFPSSLPDPLSAEEIADLAEQAIMDYVPEFTKNIADTTYNQVRDAVLRARSQGTGIEGVLRDIAPLFSRSRAELVGVTETTRLMGLGAQASYRAQGFNAWRWMAVNDPWVDPVCAGLAADSETKPFPMDKLFEPAHPRCRCFPSPVYVEPAKPAEPVKPLSPKQQEELRDKWLSSLSSNELGAVRRYVRTTQNLSADEARLLDSALSKAPPLPNSTTIYRGVQVRGNSRVDRNELLSDMQASAWKPGDVISKDYFSSTSTQESIARKFSNPNSSWTTLNPGYYPYIFEITAPKGYKAGVLWDEAKKLNSDFSNEREVLLPRNASMRVVSVKHPKLKTGTDGLPAVGLRAVEEPGRIYVELVPE